MYWLSSPRILLRSITVGLANLGLCIGLGVLGAFLLGIIAFYLLTDEQTGHGENLSRGAANGCPFPLPSGAGNVYYNYEMGWQVICSVCRFDLPTGDLQLAAAIHLKEDPGGQVPAWTAITPTNPPLMLQHRFPDLPWFRPSEIKKGWQASTSARTIWIDSDHRRIYLLFRQ